MKVNREKTASLLLAGLYGSQIADHTFTMIQRIKANPSFLTGAIIDLARQDQAITMPPGIKDISPTDAEYLAARVGAKTDAVIYTRLFYNYVQKLVDEHEKKGGMPGPLTFFMQVQLVTCARRAIQTLKRDRMSHHTIITLHNISDELLTNKEIKEGLAVLKELCETGDIDAAIITNSRTIEPTDSEEAKYEQAKLTSIALTVAGLVRGYKHHPSNRTLISVIQELQAYSRILGMSFAPEPVTEGQVRTSRRFFRWLFRNDPRANKGTGTVNDIFNQTCKAIDNAFKQIASRATNAPVPLNLPVACLCFIPIKLNDHRFPILLGLIKQYIEESYPFAIPLVIRGNGVPSPSQQGPLHFVEAACIYPIQGNQLLIPPQIIDSEAQEVEIPLEVAPEEENNHHQNGASPEKKKGGRQKKVSPGSQKPEQDT